MAAVSFAAPALLTVISLHLFCSVMALEVDPQGYILYCPCMGRFGNQADQFLGSLAFAKSLNRTLVLPPWVEYPYNYAGSAQIPFDTYFRVEPLLAYHRVLTMERFMSELAPTIWPVGQRIAFCYMNREQSSKGGDSRPSCNAKEGNPFGPFWDKFSVDFDRSEFFGPLYFSEYDTPAWKTRYPASTWPVLAFAGAPAPFPVSPSNAVLHKHLVWSDAISAAAESVIQLNLRRPYVGAHLRIGSDWENTCQHVQEGTKHHLFGSPQCLGGNFEHGTLTKAMCLPSRQIVVSQLKRIVTSTGAKSVFLARDNNNYDLDIAEAMETLGVKLYWLPESNPHLDLALLARSDHYVCNCVSSFSSFATRERNASNRPTSFWAFEPEPNPQKQEL